MKKRIGTYKLMIASALLFLSAVCINSCSTEKDTYLNKKYHNTTAHYNVWWNGNESLKAAIAELNEKVADDYTKILPIYRLGDKQEALSVAPKLDRALEKGSKGVQKHSMTTRGKEQIDYVKRCYLLMAYAYFYKQEYLTAASTCRFIMGSYNGTTLADEAKVLYARCMAKEGQYGEAEMILDQMDADLNTGKVAKETAPLLYPALAELALAQEKYKKAIDNLRLSVDNARDRTFKARLYFIMAQVYHHLDKKATATKYYKLCLKKRPAYVMEFNAQMNIAACYDADRGSATSILKMLDKMLKEKKNYEYRDQIYYAKGEMFLGAKDLKKACENYRLSVSVSTNKSQKTKSSVKLGKVLYEELQDYDEAQKYYDTAVATMPADYPFAESIRDRHKTLTSLVQHTRLIYRNDSLLRMADMDSLEREKYVKKLIAEEKKKEQERIEAELIAAIKSNSSQQSNALKGDWYFYNSSTMQRGKESFIKNWGARALEDYWFLSKKTTMSFGIDDQNANSGSQLALGDTSNGTSTTRVINVKDDKFSREYYLKDLPKTQAERDTMNMNTASSLLIAGFIYNDGIKNPDKAIECFLRIAKEFPESDNVLPAFYQLYKLYEKQGNTPSANYYKNMILRGFPDSDYANLIQDENYYLEMAKRAKMSEKEYSDIYNLYNRRRYRDVINKASSAVALYKDEKLTPKFKYWEALSYAKLGETSQAIAKMEEIVGKHPKSEIVPTVKAQIALLKKGNPYKIREPKKPAADTTQALASNVSTKAAEPSPKQPATQPQAQLPDDEDDMPAEAQMYRDRQDMQHYVMILLDDRKIKATEMQYTVADFNMEFFGTKGLRANALLFDDSHQLITVNRFANAKEAMEYYTFLTKDGGVLDKFDKADYKVYPISIQNYQTFYNQKNTSVYEKFFKKYYKNK